MCYVRNRMVSLSVARTNQTDARPALRWMHIQKTGQSFASTMLLFGCPLAIAEPAMQFLYSSHDRKKVLQADQRWRPAWPPCSNASSTFGTILGPFGGHFPLRPSQIGRLVVMLRDPQQRLLSQYEYFGHQINFSVWVRNRAHFHCQTKMLTGSACEAAVPVTSERLAQAIASVKGSDVAFVGILEHWELSIALFHCRFMRGSAVRREELSNLHLCATPTRTPPTPTHTYTPCVCPLRPPALSPL